jgi:hypothetical protein
LRPTSRSSEGTRDEHESGERPCILQFRTIILFSQENGTAEARQELYERARTALKAEFGKRDPSGTDLEVLQESLKLDCAIYDFEYSMNELEGMT